MACNQCNVCVCLCHYVEDPGMQLDFTSSSFIWIPRKSIRNNEERSSWMTKWKKIKRERHIFHCEFDGRLECEMFHERGKCHTSTHFFLWEPKSSRTQTQSSDAQSLWRLDSSPCTNATAIYLPAIIFTWTMNAKIILAKCLWECLPKMHSLEIKCEAMRPAQSRQPSTISCESLSACVCECVSVFGAH